MKIIAKKGMKIECDVHILRDQIWNNLKRHHFNHQ